MKKSCLVILLCLMLLLTACAAEKPPETTQPVTEAVTAPTTALTTVPVTEPTTEPTTQPTDPSVLYLRGSEKDALEALFYQEGTRNGPVNVNYYNRILWCDFTTPEQVDLEMIFYDQDLDENWTLTAEEEAFLQQQGVIYEHNAHVPVVRISAKKINAVLEQCFGLTLEQTDLIGMDKLIYFADTDCYYRVNGDHGACYFELGKALKYPDGTITLEYEVYDANGWQKMLTLEETESGYRVLSDVTLPQEAQSPDYEPTLKQQKIDGRYFSDEADGFSYDEAQEWIGSSPVSARKSPKYRCIMRHELIEGALYEYCLSKDPLP